VPSVFLSYRRQDASGYAGRLFDALASTFGEDRVFMDVDNIEIGTDFVERISEALEGCAAFVAVIGPAWLTVSDRSGNRRLEDPDDFVRVELATALSRDVQVIPVLVGDAVMPSAEELPPDIRPLARRQAVELSDTRWRHDLDRLLRTLRTLDDTPGQPIDPVPPAPVKRPSRRRVGAIIGLVLALVVAGVIGSALVRDSGAEPGAPSAPLQVQAVGADVVEPVAVAATDSKEGHGILSPKENGIRVTLRWEAPADDGGSPIERYIVSRRVMTADEVDEATNTFGKPYEVEPLRVAIELPGTGPQTFATDRIERAFSFAQWEVVAVNKDGFRSPPAVAGVQVPALRGMNVVNATEVARIVGILASDQPTDPVACSVARYIVCQTTPTASSVVKAGTVMVMITGIQD
jgi:hypothetical protein